MKLVVFDVDGTLVDSQADILASMRAAFAGVGLPPPDRAQILGIVGLSLPEVFAVLSPETPDLHPALSAGYKSAYMDLRARQGVKASSPLYPGIRALLAGLATRDDVLLGVATGKSRRGLDTLIEGHNLHGLFVTRQVADHHPSKPHPSMIQACLSDTGLEACDAVMVGDTSYDMEMARAAGVASIGVTWGYHDPDRLTRAGAGSLVGDAAALSQALDKFAETRA